MLIQFYLFSFIFIHNQPYRQLLTILSTKYIWWYSPTKNILCKSDNPLKPTSCIASPFWSNRGTNWATKFYSDMGSHFRGRVYILTSAVNIHSCWSSHPCSCPSCPSPVLAGSTKKLSTKEALPYQNGCHLTHCWKAKIVNVPFYWGFDRCPKWYNIEGVLQVIFTMCKTYDWYGRASLMTIIWS